MNNSYTLKDIHMAYKKFKSYVYYDNFNLHLRHKLAEYELFDLNGKLNRLCDILNNYSEDESLSQIDFWIEESGYIALPKSFESVEKNNAESNNLISNKQQCDSFDVSRVTIIYDAPIELYLISTLWAVEMSECLNISRDSYGYILETNRNSKLLFHPYFNKYQEWRDNGISAAREQVERGNNVLLVTLDIKNFFHSVNVDFKEIRRHIPLSMQKFLPLTDILEKMHVFHTKQIHGDDCPRVILPIGLPSSGLIANWILSEFDVDMKNATAPVYYGRYVDDIFLVVANVEPSNQDSLSWICERFFLNNKVISKRDGDILEIHSERCDGLQVQKDKFRLFYFDADWSLALLNKFQRNIQENSSVFWLLPEEEDMNDSLDDTYDLRYEDTQNKIRSVSDCKVNKYAASIFLAKRLKLAILTPGNYDYKLRSQIFRFFRGQAIISMYCMWEKVLTYFAITKDYDAICKLQQCVFDAISQIKLKGIDEYKIESTSIKQGLEGHFIKCLMLAQSFSKHKIGLEYSREDVMKGVKILKNALMIRHFYLPCPIFALTTKFLESSMNLDEFDVLQMEGSDVRADILGATWRIPRHVSLHEICLWQMVNSVRGQFYNIKGDSVQNEYLFSVMTLYSALNGVNLEHVVNYGLHKKYRLNHQPKIYSEIINVNSDSLKRNIIIGVSNVNTNDNEIKTAILEKSVLSKAKRARHVYILNQAERLHTDLLLLPEVFVPLDWLCAYADESRRKQRAMILGLEHFTINENCYNLSITLLPFVYHGRNEVVIIPRIKNHYSPRERMIIEGNFKKVPEPTCSIYHLYQWKGFQFSVYNCFELTDILHRSIFRSELDALFAIEYNKDVEYFGNISESMSRDLHCYYIQANTSYYGDSRIVEPKKREYQNPVRIKGGQNDTILCYELDIAALRDFQSKSYILQQEDKIFKKTPPDFQHEKVKERGHFIKK